VLRIWKKAQGSEVERTLQKKPQIEAQRSGFNLERRSDEVNERWRLFGTKKRRRERYEVREKEKPKLKPSAAGSIWKGGATE